MVLLFSMAQASSLFSSQGLEHADDSLERLSHHQKISFFSATISADGAAAMERLFIFLEINLILWDRLSSLSSISPAYGLNSRAE